ncbi:FAD-dependent monooxygenase [Mycobacterium hackensackense]|uniref:FAD-dependent monooxygenase n=1 Tax=Mycobacterium hackensackense TaxID=228909 RepID=UPI002265A01A|nr:FAD-dependent monooxygenase [Mycobacterium hackensackense]MCV7256878.1 FAD-dependent monooxygenase [Mycobacterium hackensackense]
MAGTLSRKKTPSGPVRVVIVGGGIGGLAAALALQSPRFEVSVYEQAPELGEVGAGVGLFLNSMRVLERLGVGEQVRRNAFVGTEFRWMRTDGSVLARQAVGDDVFFPVWGVYRPDLISTLAAALPTGTLHTGHRCVSFSQDDSSALVAFDNGVTVAADVVIAADGIHSTLRSHVVAPQPPVFSGVMVYRGVLPTARVSGWPWPHALANWGGQGKHFMVLPLHSGEWLTYVGFMPADEQLRLSRSAPGDPAMLAAEFAGWDPWVSRLISQVDTTSRLGLYDRDPLPRWTHGRLALLGDAAHAMLPHMGQGANQAIEDGMALATLIRDVAIADIPDALIRYQQLRHDHTARVQHQSRVNGQLADSGQLDNLFHPGVQDYDVEAHARRLCQQPDLARGPVNIRA